MKRNVTISTSIVRTCAVLVQEGGCLLGESCRFCHLCNFQEAGHSSTGQSHEYCITLVCVCLLMFIVEGSLEVKLPTIWTDEKQRWGRGREKRRVEERRL